MQLFREVDRRATAWRVIRFLDRPLDHYLALSGKHRADLKSPILDSQPKGSPTGNANEERMVNIWLATQVVECTALAMQHSRQKCQDVLLGKYAVDEMRSGELAEALHLSATTFTERQQEALNEFADRFEFWLVKRGLENEVPDLHVYQ